MYPFLFVVVVSEEEGSFLLLWLLREEHPMQIEVHSVAWVVKMDPWEQMFLLLIIFCVDDGTPFVSAINFIVTK